RTKEWQIVQCPTSCYVIGRSGTGKTTAMVFRMLGIQRAWEQVSSVRKPRQLFVTRFPVLAAKVEEFFTSLVESLALAGCTEDELRSIRSRIQSTKQQTPRMVDPLNALSYRPGTPQKYSELSDHDFPLFITFDQACISSYDRHDTIIGKVINDESSFISYEVFKTNYWPLLRDKCQSSLARRFGVIKGSEGAFYSPNGILDRQTYVNLSHRTYPVFAEDRHSLYNVFESYSKLKYTRCGYDMADRSFCRFLTPLIRTYTILKALSGSLPKGQLVDYLYVDEVQDNLIIDTILLRMLCRNADGLFWAGDTAQTISAGSSFRFQDLKAFIHRAEAKRNVAIRKSRAKPKVFELAVNYRSHSGVVNCAQLIVKLITAFWVDSIDTLRPERATLGGPKPVFFAGSHEAFLSSLAYVLGNISSSAHLGILVRDTAAREEIRKQFGDIIGVLTLQESKGLEFDDVFLYNFFEDSTATWSQWRIVLLACSDQDFIPSHGIGTSPHSVLLSELKNLYVGITRACKKLYILDGSQNSEPMRGLWLKEGLIDIAPPGTDICQYIQKPSSLEQWAASGYKLFNTGQFQEAARRFERANYVREHQIAEAYRLREVAISTLQAGEREKAFLAAAEAFAHCAGDTCDAEKTGFHREAAKCYALADRVHKAVECYIGC
ncbi:P-loop containing nucleoside triphosphate hydrolase protein, partial [Pisolithus sp. B1]